MPKVLSKCPACGIEFAHYPSRPAKHCSNKCAGLANAGNLGARILRKYEKVTMPCEGCGTPITDTTKARRRFCSLPCYGKWMVATGKILRNNPNFRQGVKPVTRVTIDCAICEKPMELKKSHAKRRRCCSLRCAGAYRALHFTGEKNGAWRGGYLPYYGPSWRPARRRIWERDKVCQDCGVGPRELGKKLDVHHIKLFRTFGVERHEEANADANLVGLCFVCHLRRPEHQAA